MFGLRIGRLGAVARAVRELFSPASLFAASEPGVWYDPSDIERYTSQLGPELVTNGDFAVDANWTKGAGWTISGGKANFDAANTATRLTQTGFAAPIGTKITFDISGVSGGTARIIIFNQSDGAIGGTFSSIGNGSYSFITTAAITDGIRVYGYNADSGSPRVSFSIDNISVKELTAIDTATMFQDSAGTTPVTAVEQPVGLMLDKSKGLVLGPELVTNGTFDTNINGWTVGNTGESTLSWENGKIRIARVNTGTTYPNARTVISGLTVGRTYKIASTTNNPFGIEAYHSIAGIAASLVRTTLASKTMECVFTATATSHNFDVGIWAASGSIGQYVEFDNISVRELPGNHATQTTATSRPVLSARKNFYVNTETLATQNVTTRAAKYIVSFWGTGSITLSGTATGTLTGTGADDRVYLEFTATAGTLTSTVSGSVLKAQLEEV